MKNHKTVSDIIKIIALSGIVILCLLLVIFAVRCMGDLFGAILLAVVIAYLLLPLQKTLEKKINSAFSALLCVVGLFGVLLLVITLVLPLIFKELSSAVSQIKYIVDYLQNLLNKIEDRLNLGISLSEILSNATKLFENNVIDIMKNAVNSIINFFKSLPAMIMVPVITFYMLKDRNYFISKIEFVIPVKWREVLKKIFFSADKVIKNYIKTQIFLAFIVGIATTVGYLLLGVPYAFLLGLLMGICEVIPYFGPVIASVPACLLVLAVSPNKLIWTVAVIVAVQQLENSFLSPFVMGSNFDINPVTVIIILWISGNVLGVAGFIFAIPIYVILKNLLSDIFDKLVKAG